jgi:hypothetical protein
LNTLEPRKDLLGRLFYAFSNPNPNSYPNPYPNPKGPTKTFVPSRSGKVEHSGAS